jgi:protein-S-isoprenylcysteine O-methyltransferase Ste14
MTGAAEPSGRDRLVAWSLVGVQFALIAVVVLVPPSEAWAVPDALERVLDVAAVVGLAVMIVAALGLGRGLTAAPLPNAHARLRTSGLFQWVRHPIYSGLLLFVLARATTSESVTAAAAAVLLVGLLVVKAGWEERRLAMRFPDYVAYAARTPRFVPSPMRLLRRSDPSRDGPA